MNDDELNELIARHKSEVAIFHEMDIQREKDALESWRARGKRGNPPPPLMQFEELPECYQTDEPFDIKDVEDLVEGRGQRRRNIVSYNDGLSDDAWAMVCILVGKILFSFLFIYLSSQALEDGEDIEELSERVKDKKIQNKLLKENDTSGRGTPASEVDGRGRKPKKGKAKANDYENSGPSGSKRKRGLKSLSVTPEVDDEDEGEGRNTVGFNYQLELTHAEQLIIEATQNQNEWFRRARTFSICTR